VLIHFIRRVLKRTGLAYKFASQLYHNYIGIQEYVVLKHTHPKAQIFHFTNKQLESQREKGYKSQIGQDYILVENGLIPRENGFFIEIGANHPEKMSNTWYLENKLGYTGIAVDPLPLVDLWTAVRPNTIFHRAFVTENTGQEIEFAEVEDQTGWESSLSGITEMVEQSGKDLKTVKSTLIGISGRDLLKEYSVSKADILFIDVEGHELSVLRGFSWSEIDIGAICVENFRESRTCPEVRMFLAQHGFVLWGRVGIFDDIFVKAG
jgi:FkbM family methyltransferase